MKELDENQSSFQTLFSFSCKATFLSLFLYWREIFFRTKHQLLVRSWINKSKKNHCIIHPSIEIRGQKKFSSFITIGEHCVLEKDCLIWIADEDGAQPKLTLESNIYLGRDVYLGVYKPLSIGKDSLIGAYSYIITANHQFINRQVPIRLQGYEGRAIEIGEDVWIGCHVVVLPGVKIGNGAVVAAGAVVTKNIPAYEIWGGVPARKLSEREKLNS